MRKIVVYSSVTLDGVMQGPARPDEDRRGGFEHGGWAAPYHDPAVTERLGVGRSTDGALLYGRWTYENHFAVWPHRGDLFSEVLNRSRKYVASTTLREPLPWQNSTLLQGDVAEAVARLKEEPGADLAVLGSGQLVQTLMRHDLVDRYVLTIHPLVLGSGRRLFPEGCPRTALALVDTFTTATGVVMATYQPAGR